MADADRGDFCVQDHVTKSLLSAILYRKSLLSKPLTEIQLEAQNSKWLGFITIPL